MRNRRSFDYHEEDSFSLASSQSSWNQRKRPKKRKYDMDVIRRLMGYVEKTLDSRLARISELIDKNKKSVKSVKKMYFKVEEKVVDFKQELNLKSGDGRRLISDDIKFFFNLVKGKSGTVTESCYQVMTEDQRDLGQSPRFGHKQSTKSRKKGKKMIEQRYKNSNRQIHQNNEDNKENYTPNVKRRNCSGPRRSKSRRDTKTPKRRNNTRRSTKTPNLNKKRKKRNSKSKRNSRSKSQPKSLEIVFMETRKRELQKTRKKPKRWEKLYNMAVLKDIERKRKHQEKLDEELKLDTKDTRDSIGGSRVIRGDYESDNEIVEFIGVDDYDEQTEFALWRGTGVESSVEQRIQPSKRNYHHEASKTSRSRQNYPSDTRKRSIKRSESRRKKSQRKIENQRSSKRSIVKSSKRSKKGTHQYEPLFENLRDVIQQKSKELSLEESESSNNRLPREPSLDRRHSMVNKNSENFPLKIHKGSVSMNGSVHHNHSLFEIEPSLQSDDHHPLSRSDFRKEKRRRR